MSNQSYDHLKAHIREVPDFPKPGINFFDITTLLLKPEAFNEVIDVFEERYKSFEIDSIVAIEARGFIFGGVLAARMSLPFVPIRKPGKLPAEVKSVEYELEYGSDSIEIHKDAINPGDRVLILDDLLATGGTAEAAIGLVQESGGTVVETAFVVDLTFLNGATRLKPTPYFSILSY